MEDELVRPAATPYEAPACAARVAWDQTILREVVASDGQLYAVETQVLWEDEEQQDLRVFVKAFAFLDDGVSWTNAPAGTDVIGRAGVTS